MDRKYEKILLNQPSAKFECFFTSFCLTSHLFTTIFNLS